MKEITVDINESMILQCIGVKFSDFHKCIVNVYLFHRASMTKYTH